MPELTQAQLRNYYDSAQSLGKTREEADEYLRSKGYSVGDMTPLERLGSQFEGTEAIPTSAVRPVSEVGAFEGLPKLAVASGIEAVSPAIGIAEKLGIMEEGSYQGVRDQFENVRSEYLSANPSAGRAAVAGATEFASQLIPLAPGLALGGKAAKLATKAGAGALGSRLAAGATAGLAEGAVVGAGATVGLPLDEQLKTGALMTAAGGALGALGGAKAPSVIRKVNPEAVRFRGKYLAGDAAKKVDGESFLLKIRRNWEDSFLPARRSVEKVVKSGKATKSELEDFDVVVQQARTGDHMAAEPIERHTRSVITNEVTGESFDDAVLKGLTPEAISENEVYLTAMRNLELARRAEVGEVAHEVASEALSNARKAGKPKAEIEALKFEAGRAKREAGIKVTSESIADSERLVKELGGTEADARAKRFVQWSRKAVLEPLREVGVFSDEAVNDMMAKGQWHIPFQRAMRALDDEAFEAGIGAPVRGKRIHRGLGSNEADLLKNPYETAAEVAIRVHSFARKQAVRNHLADFADAHLDELGAEIFKSPVAKKGRTFRVFRNGELLNYEADKGLVEAIESLNFREANLIFRASRALTQLFRAGATMTPEFGVRNIAKDWLTFGVYSKHTAGGMKTMLAPARAMFDVLANSAGIKTKNTKYWDEFLGQPVAHSTFLSGDMFRLNRYIKIAKQSHDLSKPAKFWAQTKRNPLYPLQALNQTLERMPRFAEYTHGRKAGLTPQQADLGASDVTLNFPRAGVVGRKVNLHYAFFNAQMQDISKFARAMKERPFTTSARAMSFITLPSVLAWAAMKDNETYQTLPEWEKALFIHLYQFPNGRFLRMPMPPGILGLMFSYIPRKVLDFAFDKDPRAVERALGEFVEQTPLQYAPMPYNLNSMEDAVTRAMPNSIRPLMEIMTNRTPFFDRPAISERLLRRDASEEKTRYTSNLAKGIAGGIGKFPGMSETKMASPATVEYLLAGYGAGIGRRAMEWSGNEAGLRSMRGVGIFGWPGLRGMVSTSPVGFGSLPVQDFYDLSERVDEKSATLRIQSTREHERNYLMQHPEAAYAKETRKVKKVLSEYSEMRVGIQELENITEGEREDQLLKIDQAVTLYAATMLGEFYKAIDRDHQVANEYSAKENR